MEENNLQEQNKKLTKKQIKLIAIISGAIIIILLLLFGIRGGIKSGKANAKKNLYNLAKTYADRGEYDRALNKLDSYLEKHGDDEDIWNLWNEIIEKKKEAENAAGNSEVNSNYQPQNNFTIDVDTSDISNAVKDALEQTNRQAEDNRIAMENLLKIQENQQKLQEQQQRAEEQRKAEEKRAEELKRQKEEERKAEEAARAEQQRIAEEKRKAEEAEAIRKNAELKKKLDAVNEEIRKGKIALGTGEDDKALEHFDNALNIMPPDAGKVVIASKESEMAQALYDAAEKTDDKDKKKRLMKEAVEMAKKAVADNPKDATAHYILAQNALNNNDLNTALEEMKAAVNYDPYNYLYYYNLGKIQYTQKKYSEASSSFTTSCKLNDKFAPSRYNLGLTQKQLKNDSAALDAFRKTIDIDPRHEKAYLEEGKILTARGDYTGAIVAYEEVLKINNINVQAANLLAGVYYQKGNYDKAEECYKRALTMLDKDKDAAEMVMAKYNLSTVLFDHNKTADAEKYAREAYESKDALKSDISKADIIYNYALILDNMGKDERAISYYREALSKNSDHKKAKLNLGNKYLALDPPDTDTAINLFTQVYNKDNNNVEANNQLGNAYLMIQEYSNAIKYYQNALKLDSKNNAIRANLAKAYAQSGDYDYAKATYTELLKVDKENWDAYIELAKVCMQLDDNDNAEKYLIYVQEKKPGYRKNEVKELLDSLL